MVRCITYDMRHNAYHTRSPRSTGESEDYVAFRGYPRLRFVGVEAGFESLAGVTDRSNLMVSSRADTSSPPASWGNEDRRSGLIKGPHLFLLPILCHLYRFLPLQLLSIAKAIHRIFLLQSCPSHPHLYISIYSWPSYPVA